MKRMSFFMLATMMFLASLFGAENVAAQSSNGFKLRDFYKTTWVCGMYFFNVFADTSEALLFDYGYWEKLNVDVTSMNTDELRKLSKSKIKHNPNYMRLLGGTPHEGGVSFGLEAVAAQKFKLDGTIFTPVGSGSIKSTNGHAVYGTYHTYNNFKWISIVDGNNFAVLTPFVPDYMKVSMVQLIAGKYYDEKTNESIEIGTNNTFNGKKFCIVDGEYDFPANVIQIAGNEKFYYEYNDNGISLYEAIADEYDNYSKGKFVRKLVNSAVKNKNIWYYPYTSSVILNYYELEKLPKAQLRVMRNEIFARHNRPFKSADLQKIFEGRCGYKPNPNFKDSELSPIEMLNVELLSQAERGAK